MSRSGTASRAAWWASGLLALAGGAKAADGPWWWRMPAAPEVVWRGTLPTEGGAVGMGTQIGLYPVFGVGGLLVAIFTHAAISQSVQSAERKKAQDDADKVLAPYGAALKAWPASALWEAARAAAPAALALNLWDGQAPPTGGLVVEAAPVYTMAQDEGVLVLDVAVKFVPSPGATPLETVVRVVSSPHDAADARAHWSADESQRLKSTAAAMLAHALHTAITHARAPAGDTPPRTHRYLQGSVERTERAQQLGGDCSRAVLRTLRGWLLSVPLSSAPDTPCLRTTSF